MGYRKRVTVLGHRWLSCWFMASLMHDFKGKVNLIFIDPCFDVGTDFGMTLAIGDAKETSRPDKMTARDA